MQNFVFDLYGTLLDISTDEYSQKFTSEFSAYASRAFGAGGGVLLEYRNLCGRYGGFIEPDVRILLKQAIEASGGTVSERQSYGAAAVFRSLSTRRLRVYRGARKLLVRLKEGGAKLYLLSNAQASFTYSELKKTRLYNCFDGIELSSEFGYKKPSPAFFAHLIHKYGLNAAQTIYTGNDIFCDILPARDAGLKTAYIRTAISPREDTLGLAAEYACFATQSFGALATYLIRCLYEKV